jgi:hypothetical protein
VLCTVPQGHWHSRVIDVPYVRVHGQCRPQGHWSIEERCYRAFPQFCKSPHGCRARRVRGQKTPKRALTENEPGE